MVLVWLLALLAGSEGSAGDQLRWHWVLQLMHLLAACMA
jgi:hypothetical protein